MSQGMQQPQGQMISGYYVAPSLTQQLNPIANMLAGQAVGERADTKQAELATALRTQGNAAVQKVMQTFKQNPNLGVQEAAQLQQFPQVKALLPTLAKALEQTPEERKYQAAIADGSFKGGFNAFMNQMSDTDKERLRLENLKYNLDKQKFDLENAPFNPAAFGQPSAQAAPQVMPPGAPVVKPAGLLPTAPAYAQGAMNFQAPQAPQLQPQTNAPQTLPAPPAWVRTQKDYKDWLKSESEPLTEFQGKAVLYGSGMLQANNVINKLSAEGTVTGAVTPAFLSGIAALAPLGVGDAAVNAINSAFRADPTGFVGPDKNQQKLAQAQLGFAIPYLRQTSGANFGAKEVADTIAEYFPLMGEDKEVAKQKEASRNRVIQGMKSVSGRGARQIEELGNISAPSGWGKAQVVRN